MSGNNEKPKSIVKPVKCPFCKRFFDYEVFPEIIIPGDSKLKKRLLNGSLFQPICPHCGEEFKLKVNCMFRNDNKGELIVATESEDAKYEEFLTSGGIHFDDVKTKDDAMNFVKGLLKRRVVHDVDSFREKVLLSEYNYDDRIIELMKLSLAGLMEKEYHEPVYRIFLGETSGNQMEFEAIMGAKAPFEYVTVKTPANVYTHFKNKYLDKLGKPEDDEYIITDQKWAKESGLLEEEDPGFIIPLRG